MSRSIARRRLRAVPLLAVIASLTLPATAGAATPVFAAPQAYTTGGVPLSLDLGAVDAVAGLDVVVAAGSDHALSLHAGNNTGSFQGFANSSIGRQPATVKLFDADGDGDLDALVGENNTSSITLMRNTNGNGLFVADSPVSSIAYLLDATTGDIDGDGDLDAIVAAYSGAGVHLNDGSGGFGAVIPLTTAGQSRGVRGADVDGDGKLDIVTVNGDSGMAPSGSISVLRGNGDGTFVARVDYAMAIGAGVLALADFNSDGHVDVATAHASSNTLSVRLNSGTGTFSTRADLTTDENPSGIVAADFDADGLVDLAVSARKNNHSGNAVNVFANTGSGVFAPKVTFATADAPSDIAAGDVNADGLVDLITSNAGATSTINVLINSPDVSAPVLTMDSGPAHGSTIGTRSATFAFSTNEPAAPFRCQIDAGTVNVCTSPLVLNDLANGVHTVRITSRDAGSNDAVPLERTFTVAPPVPRTTFTSEPAAVTTETTVTFTYAADVAGSTYTCSFDGGARYACGGPQTFANLALGIHVFDVQATSPLGQVEMPAAARTFTVVAATPPLVDPPKPTQLVVGFGAVPSALTLNAAIAKGVSFAISCNQACSSTTKLTVSAKVARSLGLIKRTSTSKQPVLVGSAAASTKAAGRVAITVRLTAAAKKAFAKARSVRFASGIVVTSANGRSESNRAFTLAAVKKK